MVYLVFDPAVDTKQEALSGDSRKLETKTSV